MKRNGFTLIELLVVITIIVVLLALLVPAMDKAIYQAELTVCGTNVRAIGSGATLYAVDNNRRYPKRDGIGAAWQPQDWQRGGTNPGNDRPRMKPYLALGRNGPLNCPLTGKVDIEASHPDTWILGAYALWYGWQIRDPLGVNQRGMFRIGDRLGWYEERFDILASDHDLVIVRDDWGTGTHPDRDGAWPQIAMQDTGIIIPTAAAGPTGFKATLTRWQGVQGAPGMERGPVEMNFAYQDGSVKRYDDVSWQAGDRATPDKDPRMTSLPYTSTSDGWAEGFRVTVPVR